MNLSPIRLHRELKGLSQLQLSALTGISNHRICQIEKGWKEPKIIEIIKIAKALKVEPSRFVRVSSNGKGTSEGSRSH